MNEKDLIFVSYCKRLEELSKELEAMVNSPDIPYESSVYGFLFTAMNSCENASRHIRLSIKF